MTKYLKIPQLVAEWPVTRFFLESAVGLRQMSSEDLSYLYRLRHEVIRPYYQRRGRRWHPDDQIEWVEENVDPSHSFVIQRSRPIGVVGLYPLNPRAAWLRHFYIEPNSQGYGFGSEVITNITRMTDSLGMDVELFKVPKDGPRSFYERHGFVAIEEREHEIYMRRNAA